MLYSSKVSSSAAQFKLMFDVIAMTTLLLPMTAARTTRSLQNNSLNGPVPAQIWHNKSLAENARPSLIFDTIVSLTFPGILIFLIFSSSRSTSTSSPYLLLG